MTNAGWDVTIVTGFPNHPGGNVFGGYRKKAVLRERKDGYQVVRVYLFTSTNRSKWLRLLTFVTYTLTSSVALILMRRQKIIFSVFQPISLAATLPFIAKLRRAKLVFNVQDLHPDAQIRVGLIKNPVLIRFLRFLERLGYRWADHLTVISDTFREHCKLCGVSPDRIDVIPNWIDTAEIQPLSRDTDLRRSLGYSIDDIIVLYAGTIGFASGAEVLLDAAVACADRRLCRFVFVGEGPLVEQLKERVRAAAMPNVEFLPFQDRDKLADVQATADISVASLLPGQGRYSVPSKVLGYMAAGRPVVLSAEADCETANLINEAACGVVTTPGDGTLMAEAIVALATDRLRRERLGANARAYVVDKFGKHGVVARYRELFDRLATG